MGKGKGKCGYDKNKGRLEPDYCKEPVYGNTGKCIFHAPAEKKEKQEFWEEFDKYIDDRARGYGDTYTEFEIEESFLDCRGFVFPETDKYFAGKRFDTHVDLSRAVFAGYVEFAGTYFEKEVLLENTEFKGNVTFFLDGYRRRVSFYKHYF